MSPRKNCPIIVLLEGGEEIPFKPKSQPWCSYQLEDGYSVRLKLVATQIVKAPQKDANGRLT